jgi:hypothetical protein
MNSWKKWKPGMDKKWLYFSAGLMWSAVGVMLCYLAFEWLKPVPIDRWILLTLGGVLLAATIYAFGFSKLADKNIRRIRDLAGDKICLFAFMEWTSYPLVIVFVSLGIFLRMYSPIPKPLLAVMYIGIGGSLFLASLHYYKRIWETERRRVADSTCESN